MMSKLMNPEHVFLDVDLTQRDDVLKFLSNKAVELGMATNSEDAFEAFLIREEEGPTGMIEDFAIPHAKADVIDNAGIIVTRLKDSAPDWPSFDDAPISIAIALLIPGVEAGTTHIRLLSKCAVLINDENFRDELRKTNDPQHVSNLINAGLEDKS